MEASRAATGMSEVLAISTVRSISGRPVLGSVSAGNSLSTSVISLPRSPQPMYTTTSASAHLASWCWVTVLPLPNGPGIAATPPFASGNRQSITRCPVMSGRSGASFLPTGRALRTGQAWHIASVCTPPSPCMVQTGSSTVYWPARISCTTPQTPGGANILCNTSGVSCTVPSTSPGCMRCPVSTHGQNSHALALSSCGARCPRKSRLPAARYSVVSGRPMPSKMPPTSPGPSSMDSGCPSDATCAPTSSPLVSSYTWI